MQFSSMMTSHEIVVDPRWEYQGGIKAPISYAGPTERKLWLDDFTVSFWYFVMGVMPNGPISLSTLSASVPFR